jgi:hypothetical protein
MERNVLRGAVRAAARLVQKQAQANIHSVSGETARSVKVGSRVSGGEVVAYVRVKSYKGKWLEYGTRPHRIRAKNGEALAFGGTRGRGSRPPGRARAGVPAARLDSQARAGVIAAGEYIKRRLATSTASTPPTLPSRPRNERLLGGELPVVQRRRGHRARAGGAHPHGPVAALWIDRRLPP